MNRYLIPANSKKSQLILGFFNVTDLIIFICGVGISLILLMVIKTDTIGATLALASPAIIAAFLVAPIPNYHNVRTFIGNVWNFFTNRRRYYWRGWCARYENRNK